MKTFKYSEFTKLKSHDEVAKSKSGSCHDQVMYEFEELRRMGKDPKGMFFIEYKAGYGGGTTHSICYWNESGKTYYLENAWGGREGIKTFKNEEALLNYMVSLKNKGEFGDNSKYPDFLVNRFDADDHEPGETLSEFVNMAIEDEALYSREKGGP